MNVTLNGDLSTTRVDGSALPAASVGSVNIYRQAGTGTPAKVGVATITGATFTYVDLGPAAGSYNYGATVVDTAGTESAISNLFPVVVPGGTGGLAAPSPPTIVSGVAA